MTGNSSMENILSASIVSQPSVGASTTNGICAKAASPISAFKRASCSASALPRRGLCNSLRFHR